MPNYQFDHVHLNSQEPLKTAEFYKKNFGATQVSTRELGDGRVTIKLDLNGTTILVTQPRSDSPQSGLAHFGFSTDNLEAAVAELKAKDVNFTQEAREIRPGFKISFLLAPEDVSIELQEGNF